MTVMREEVIVMNSRGCVEEFIEGEHCGDDAKQSMKSSTKIIQIVKNLFQHASLCSGDVYICLFVIIISS